MFRAFRYVRPVVRDCERLVHVRQVLQERRVYLPRPSQLNDPLDCRPRMVRPTLAQIAACTQRGGAQRAGGHAQAKKRRELKASAAKKLSSPQYLQHLQAIEADRWGVLSLSRSKCNPHLWSQYADNGTGLCLEFDFNSVVERGMQDWVPMPVEYAAVAPEMNVLDFVGGVRIEEFVRLSVRTKTFQWMAEEEIRLVMLLENKPQFVTIPDRTIRAVYLGPRCADHDIVNVLEWAGVIPVFRTRIEDSGAMLFEPQ